MLVKTGLSNTIALARGKYGLLAFSLWDVSQRRVSFMPQHYSVVLDAEILLCTKNSKSITPYIRRVSANHGYLITSFATPVVHAVVDLTQQSPWKNAS